MKRFKKPKNNITLSNKDILALKKDITETAVGTSTLVYLTATKDELGVDMDTLIKIFLRATRYCEYLDDKLIEMKTLADDLYKDTGIRINWR